MCFYNDYDWYAELVEDEIRTADQPTRCGECGTVVPEEGTLRHIYYQQYEICRRDHYEGGPGCSEDCEHDFGETFDFDLCEACNQLIEAIHQFEIEEGCGEAESRPAFGELYDAIYNRKDYLEKAESLYPGITSRLSETFRCVLGVA